MLPSETSKRFSRQKASRAEAIFGRRQIYQSGRANFHWMTTMRTDYEYFLVTRGRKPPKTKTFLHNGTLKSNSNQSTQMYTLNAQPIVLKKKLTYFLFALLVFQIRRKKLTIQKLIRKQNLILKLMWLFYTRLIPLKIVAT